MSGDAKFFLGVAIVAVLAIAGFVVFSSPNKSSDDVVDIDYSAGQKMGEDSAKIRIVEFGDFQCPSCGQSAAPLKTAVEKNADNVQLIWRHFPLTTLHANAFSSALAAEAAASQGKFWPMLDLLFQNQTDWSGLTDPTETFVGYAKGLGLDEGKFRSDLKAKELEAAINRDADYGESIGVDQTPTFFVNGRKYTGGRSEGDWQKLFDDILSAATSG